MVHVIEPRKTIRLGGGSACAEDWIDPAVELAEKGNLDYICFDSLSEAELSTVALAKLMDPAAIGYDSFLDERIRRVLPASCRNGVKIIGNMGSGDPVGAAKRVIEIAHDFGITKLRVAAVLGDNILDRVASFDLKTAEDGRSVNEFEERLISAHAYVPCDPVVEALRDGADVVLTGRISDAALFLAPMMYEFDWAADDWDAKAKGTVVGHLMECGGQLTGGYFADPPYKVVPDMHRLGFPIAEVSSDGDVVFTKVEGSGGIVSTQTCKEQMLYETSDPGHYIHPDVVVDFRQVEFEQIGPDRVRMGGTIKGKPAPETLKVALGVREGFRGQATVFYGGIGAYQRAKAAADMLEKRFEYLGFHQDDLRIDLLGVNAMFGDDYLDEGLLDQLWEVGLRISVLTQDFEEAFAICREGSNNLSNNGPAATSAAQRQIFVRPVVGYHHTFFPREEIAQHYVISEV